MDSNEISGKRLVEAFPLMLIINENSTYSIDIFPDDEYGVVIIEKKENSKQKKEISIYIDLR